ncbi:carbohydrate ABC transporter permease [Paenibacillus harenae]|uniref:carbohydrate ABC transporter permease n=1 Tax=Paenibacillus harenae TaxID=306543 RepID=UPI0004105F19|nr:carbohydrate ABC transporter permease [Paenibacillus harenae]
MVNSGINKLPLRIAVYGLIALLTVIFGYPFVLTVVNSLNPLGSLPTLLPAGFDWNNYVLAVTMIEFPAFLKNSLIICAIYVPLTTMSSALAGFAFARLHAPGKKLFFLVITSTMMLPQIVTQIPTYILFNKLDFNNTFYPWLLWGIGGAPFFIFLYKQFFSSIPKELEEAARIDGCSTLRIYWTIFLPLATPATWTAAITCFQWTWGDFITPFMFLKDENYPLATALATIGYHLPDNPNVVLQQPSSAAAILFMIPTIAVFFFGQRYLVDGIAAGAVKG